jgi:hypothetical protein
MGWEEYAKIEDHVLSCGSRAAEELAARQMATTLLTSDGHVRLGDLGTFHRILTQRLFFTLVDATQNGVRPGGWHLFYRLGHLVCRVKTTGTNIRPRPHLTLSLAIGLGWQDELQKFRADGRTLPKTFSRLDPSDWRWAERASQWEESWAQQTHFDFPQPFDDAAAANIAAHRA